MKKKALFSILIPLGLLLFCSHAVLRNAGITLKVKFHHSNEDLSSFNGVVTITDVAGNAYVLKGGTGFYKATNVSQGEYTLKVLKEDKLLLENRIVVSNPASEVKIYISRYADHCFLYDGKSHRVDLSLVIRNPEGHVIPRLSLKLRSLNDTLSYRSVPGFCGADQGYLLPAIPEGKYQLMVSDSLQKLVLRDTVTLLFNRSYGYLRLETAVGKKGDLYAYGMSGLKFPYKVYSNSVGIVCEDRNMEAVLNLCRQNGLTSIPLLTGGGNGLSSFLVSGKSKLPDNSSEALRSLRRSPLVSAAGPYIHATGGTAMIFTNRIHVACKSGGQKALGSWCAANKLKLIREDGDEVVIEAAPSTGHGITRLVAQLSRMSASVNYAYAETRVLVFTGTRPVPDQPYEPVIEARDADE